MDRSLAVRRLAPVAVFAAVLGGVVVVSTQTGGDGTRAPRPLPIRAASGAEGRASDASRPMAAGAPEYWSEIHIPDRLLEGIPTEGPAYTLKADDDRIEALARALGVDGEPKKQDGTWTVGSGEKVLQVMPYAGQPWYLGAQKPGREPGSGTGTGSDGGQVVAEPAPPATAKPDEPTTSGTTPPTAPDECPTPPPGAEPYCAAPAPMPAPTMPPQPSDGTARAAMDRVLAAVGQRDATVTTSPGYMGKEVTAAPVVAGLPTTGYETRITVDADGGIVHASGFLARLERDATYPLLDPRKAVQRGYGGYAGDVAVGRPADGQAEPAPAQTANDMPLITPATSPATSGPGDAIEPATPPAPPRGDPSPAPEPSPQVREAKTLRLGLMFMPSYDGRDAAFLVPAWLLGFEGDTWEHPFLALPDEYVATPPAPSGDPDQPVCDPSPCPTKDAPPPPDGSTSGGGSSGYDPGAPAVDTSRSGS